MILKLKHSLVEETRLHIVVHWSYWQIYKLSIFSLFKTTSFILHVSCRALRAKRLYFSAAFTRRTPQFIHLNFYLPCMVIFTAPLLSSYRADDLSRVSHYGRNFLKLCPKIHQPLFFIFKQTKSASLPQQNPFFVINCRQLVPIWVYTFEADFFDDL